MKSVGKPACAIFALIPAMPICGLTSRPMLAMTWSHSAVALSMSIGIVSWTSHLPFFLYSTLAASSAAKVASSTVIGLPLSRYCTAPSTWMTVWPSPSMMICGSQRELIFLAPLLQGPLQGRALRQFLPQPFRQGALHLVRSPSAVPQSFPAAATCPVRVAATPFGIGILSFAFSMSLSCGLVVGGRGGLAFSAGFSVLAMRVRLRVRGEIRARLTRPDGCQTTFENGVAGSAAQTSVPSTSHGCRGDVGQR